MPTGVSRTLYALIVGTSGGALFYLLSIPLPWTLGSLTATALAVMLGRDWRLPSSFREVARPLVGVLAGSAFVPAVLAALIDSWLVILYVASYSIIIAAAGFLFFTRLRYDRVTAFFMSTPGGLGELILISAQLSGNVRAIVVSHTIRVVAVVVALPLGLQLITEVDLAGTTIASTSTVVMDGLDWLMIALCCAAGYIAGSCLKMQGGAVIAALVASAALHATGLTQGVPPGWLVALVQIVIGASAGARFAGMRWVEVRRTLLHALVWAAIMLSVAALMALLGSLIFDRTFPALLLGTAPGGLPEMTIVTYALGIDVAFVVTCHVCRVLMVLLIAPSIGTWLSRRGGRSV